MNQYKIVDNNNLGMINPNCIYYASQPNISYELSPPTPIYPSHFNLVNQYPMLPFQDGFQPSMVPVTYFQYMENESIYDTSDIMLPQEPIAQPIQSSTPPPSFCQNAESVLSKTTKNIKKKKRVTVKKVKTVSEGTLTCPKEGCEKTFKRSEHLKRHLNSVHNPIKSFICNFIDCGKAFSRSDNLNQHIRTHMRRLANGLPQNRSSKKMSA